MAIFVLSPWDWRAVVAVIALSPATIVRNNKTIILFQPTKWYLGLANSVESYFRGLWFSALWISVADNHQDILLGHVQLYLFPASELRSRGTNSSRPYPWSARWLHLWITRQEHLTCVLYIKSMEVITAVLWTALTVATALLHIFSCWRYTLRGTQLQLQLEPYSTH